MVTDHELVAKPKERLRLIIKSGDIELSDTVPARRYLRSAPEIFRMATVYHEEGNLEEALILYTRYIVLLLDKMPKHPDYKSLGKDDKHKYQKYLKQALDLAEKIKKSLENKFDIEAENLKKEQEEAKKLAELAASRQNEDLEEAPSLPSPQGLTSDQLQPFLTDTYNITFPELNKSTVAKPPVPARNLKPPDGDKKPSNTGAVTGFNYTPGGDYGLRDIIIPNSLAGQFLKLAERNTERNIETCGILCGKLAQNKFVVTHVVVPKQSGTPDSCNTEKEEEVFDFQDKHELITVGWIHTHPTQTAFLSSVDLHTHCSYQLMLPEAVAVVCSPKFGEIGVFMLTPEHGLREISSCRESGFHPHSQAPPLFQVCPHAQFSDGYSASVVDLRNSS